MSAQWDLQRWLFSALTTALAGQGEAGADIAVFDSVPSAAELDGARFHCRIDMIGLGFLDVKGADVVEDEIRFMIHIFDRPVAAGQSRGRRDALRLIGLAKTAIRGQQPTGLEGAIRVQREEVLAGEDANLTHGRLSCVVSV